MLNKKIIFLLVLVMAFSIFITGCTNDSNKADKDADKVAGKEEPNTAKKPIELKLGTKMNETSQEGKVFQRFADLVGEKTNGEVIVSVFPSEQLGDTMTQIDNLSLGTQDLYVETINYFARYDKVFNISTIPYLFTDNKMYIEMMQGDLGKSQEKALENNGFKLLSTNRDFIRGPYRVMCSTVPIRTVEDFKGLRMRSFDSEIYMAAYNELSANPIVLAWTETYLALKQNTVKAVTSPISLVYDMKFTEVAPYVTKINEYPTDLTFIMNKKKFDSLTEEQQKALIDAANDAAVWSNEQLDAMTEADIQKMIDEHGAEFIEIDTQPAREELREFFTKLEAEGSIPEGMVESLY